MGFRLQPEGRLRQEPLGVDRNWREFYLHGGISGSDGELAPSDLARLLVRTKAARADEPEDWRVLTKRDELQRLLRSLRLEGVREHQLHKALTAAAPRIEKAMAAVGGSGEQANGGGEQTNGEVAGGLAAKADSADDDAEGADGGKSDAGKAIGEEPEAADDLHGDWTASGWRSVASRVLRVTGSEERNRQHRKLRLLVVPRTAGASSRLSMLDRCKLHMVDVVNALPVPPPDAPDLRPGSEAARKHWASMLRSAEAPQALSEVLQTYVRMVPKAAFKKGFRKWWLSDGGVDEARQRERLDKELRKLGEGGGGGGGGSRGAKDADKKADDANAKKDSKEMPPPQAETAHQVMLRLHMLDAGLIYCS